MKEIIIKVPDNCEFKKEGNTYIIVQKEKKLTYKDVAEKLFFNKDCTVYINSTGNVVAGVTYYENSNNCTSERQAEKLLAINKLMNIAKYLNDGWQPDWKNRNEDKIFIYIDYIDKSIKFGRSGIHQSSEIYFKSEELAKQAIEILGEETIRLALCTDY